MHPRAAAACAGGQAVAQDGLGEPVQLEAALVDPSQRLAGELGQGLPPGQRVRRPGRQLPGQFAGRVGEEVLRDRLGGQERGHAGQSRGGRVLPSEPVRSQPVTAASDRG